MGFSGWLNPAGWPRSLPPITLLDVIAVLIPLLVKLLWISTSRSGGSRKITGSNPVRGVNTPFIGD
jgi:hypothetical protein